MRINLKQIIEVFGCDKKHLIKKKYKMIHFIGCFFTTQYDNCFVFSLSNFWACESYLRSKILGLATNNILG